MRAAKIVSVCMVLLLSLVVGIGSAQAQEEVRFGVKGGLTLARFDSEVDVDGIRADFNNDTGFAVGAFLDMPLGEGLSLQPELMYQQRRTELDLPMGMGPGFGDPQLQVRTAYLEVPVLLRYTAGDGAARPYLLAGGALALNLDAEIHERFGGTELTEDIKDETSDLDLGLALGAGVELDMGVVLEARYTLGLTDADDTEDPQDIKWRTFLFAVGFVF